MGTKEDKVAFARSQGIAMGSTFHGAIIGWTTNEKVARACRDEGLMVTRGYNKTGPPGWEVVAR